MSLKYEVVLPGRPPGGVEVAARAMAEAFRIPESKAAGLLRRVPGPLTKEIDEREAVRVAYRLRKLGLAVEIRPVDAEPAATAVGRAARSSASAATADREASPAADPAATPTVRRSPFLSQVDETPPRIPGLDDVLSSRAGERRHRDRRHGFEHGGTGTGRPPSASRDTPWPESTGSQPPRSEPARSEPIQTVVARPLSARTEQDPAQAARSEGLRPGPQPHSERALGVRTESERTAVDAMAAEGRSTEGASTPRASGSWRSPEVLRTGERVGGRQLPVAGQARSVRSPFGRHLLVATVLPGLLAFAALATTSLLVSDRSFAIAFVVGLAVLALTAGCVWLSARPLLREHDRVLAETVRISRGDLARPVQASDRYPEAVQALERIRVSLQEGLDRLRRRKR